MSVERRGTGDESADSQSKSRQARIRDNQRRSRARRQEHLQDLEKRLQDCHVSCREAELQQTAFKDLQTENVRLRQLLDLVGVDTSLTNTFLAQSHPRSQNGSTSLRHLRPKMPIQSSAPSLPESIPSVTTGSERLSAATAAITSLSSCSSNSSGHSTSSGNFDLSNGFLSMDRTPTSTETFSLMDSPQIQSFIPNFQSDTIFASGAYSDDSFCCMVFGTKSNGQLRSPNEDTIECSMAKEMIDQYNICDEDLEHVKQRLSVGFAPPACPGQGCRVSHQLLFEVLNDISGTIS